MSVKPYPTEQPKKEQMHAMFDRIAPRYDLLNHTLSFGIDRRWRRRVVEAVAACRPTQILDVATGTGDLAVALARRIREAHVTGVDLSEKMLDVAQRKTADRGLAERIALRQGDAERLGFDDASFDAATVAFGVRNFGDLDAGLRELARVLRPGGRLFVLEFSRPRNRLFRALYEFYTFRVLPLIGGAVSRDRQAYAYLPASVGEFPAPDAFIERLARAGFSAPCARSISGGIAYLYIGEK